jgi:hypothetical protein
MGPRHTSTRETPSDHAELGPADRPARKGTLGRRLAHLYGRHIGPMEQSLLISWASFAVTFAAARLITHGIRGGWLPVHDIVRGKRHVHHYNLGIILLAGVGLIAVRGLDRQVRHPVTAAAYGAGAALVADEFALLLDLEDVYWAREGRISVDVALGIIASLGIYFTSIPFWHGLWREVRRPTNHHQSATESPRI